MLRKAFLIAPLFILVALCLLGVRRASTQTSTIRRVTNTPEESFSLNPSLSGDGRHLAFESNADLTGAGGEPGFRAFLGLLDSEPALFTELGVTRATAPAISQDGSIIAFASKDNPLGTNSDGNSEIFLYSSGQLRQITNTLPDDVTTRHIHGNFQPSLTDDGRMIAFASNRELTGQNSDANLEIYIYDTVANSITQLTSSSSIIGSTDAKICGDGSHVAYVKDHGLEPSAERDLILHNLNTGESQTIASSVNELALTYGRAISDDGLRVVYASKTEPDTTQVFAYDGRNNTTRQLTSLGARAVDVPLRPTVSGDGKRVAFATRRNVIGGNTDNSVELYTYDLPTSHFEKVTNAPSSATAEVVSSLNDDGSLVAFNFPRVLSGSVSSSSLANNSEIYVATTEVRPPYSSDISIKNGASFGHEPSTYDAVSPDSIAVAFGDVLAFDTIQAQPLPNGNFPTVLGGTTVSINNRPAQLFSVSPTRITFHVPPETETAFAEIVVTNTEGFQTRGTVRVLTAAPGIFTGSGDGLGAGVIVDAKTAQPGPFDPTDGPRDLIVYATGARRVPSQLLVTIGGRQVPVVSVIASIQTPGLDLIRIQLPRDLRGAGDVSLSVRAGRRESNPVSLTITGSSNRDVFINEVLADPPDGEAGDANHDGVRSGTDDEFIELVNTEPDDVNISGWTIRTHPVTSTNETTRHVFAAGTIIRSQDALVIFGGGDINPNHPAFGGTEVVTTTSAGLSLTNGGLTILIRDAAGNLITEFSYGGSTGLDGNANQSLARSPDRFGSFVLHALAPGAGGRTFSPGTLLDGTFFIHRERFLTSVSIAPTSLGALANTRVQVKARGLDQFGQAVRSAGMTFTSTNPDVALVESVRIDRRIGTATATIICLESGKTEIRATATDGIRNITSDPATLNVSVPIIPTAGQVIINEALVSFAAGSLPRVDFIELYNTTNQTLDISGIVISYRATGATTTVSTVHLAGMVGSGTSLLPPNGYFLIANGPSTFGVNADMDASSSAFDMNNSSGAVKIEISGVKLDGLRYQQNGSSVPPVAFDNFGEGTLFTFAGGTPNDLIRSPNAIDTNNNLNDFRRNNSHATVSPKGPNPAIP